MKLVELKSTSGIIALSPSRLSSDTNARSNNRAASRRTGKRPAENGQAVRHEKGRANPLQPAEDQQRWQTWGEPARDGRDGEHRRADDEKTLTSKPVSQCSTQQEESAQRQEIGVYDPVVIPNVLPPNPAKDLEGSSA
jgi:hypothetical protein